MELAVAVLLVSFLLLLALNVPISISIGVSTLLTMLITIDPVPALVTMAQRMASGIDSFALLAIPFFILSGLLMGSGGIARRIINFARVLVGMLPGGLAFVNIISCTLFGSISGSAVAATSAIVASQGGVSNTRDRGVQRNRSLARSSQSRPSGQPSPSCMLSGHTAISTSVCEASGNAAKLPATPGWAT